MTEAPVRALVTRPAEQAGATAARLADAGIEPVLEPLLTIQPAAAGIDLDGTQAVLLTSRNGARALAAATPLRGIPVAAVGDATAQAAREAGFSRVISASGSSADLVHLVGGLDAAKGRLVHVTGEVEAGDLTGRLRAKGFTVDRAVLYKAVPARKLSASTSALISQGGVAMALFFSPRTASVFAALARKARVAKGCAAIRGVFISEASAEAASDLPWRAQLVAARPHLAAVIDAAKRARG